MMCILSDEYHDEMHVGSHIKEHAGLFRRTVVCEHGSLLLFASTITHRGLVALPGVGKQVVFFCFLTSHKRRHWLDVQRFILDPLPSTTAKLAHHPSVCKN